MTIDKISRKIKNYITERIYELAEEIDPSDFVDDEEIMEHIQQKVLENIDIDDLIRETLEEEL